MPTLSERLMKVALLGVVPADDQHVIADANAELARLEEANGLIARADAAKEEEIERLRTAGKAVLKWYGGATDNDSDWSECMLQMRDALGVEQGAHDPRDDFSPENDPFHDEQHVEPHAYVPSAMHMGDCSVCGHRQNDPLHDEAV